MPLTTLDNAQKRAIATVKETSSRFGLRYPDDTTKENWYPLRPAAGGVSEGGNHGWTTSFVPGELWLAWENTGDESFRDAALQHVASFVERVDEEIDLQTHDLGFLYLLSCIVPTILTPDAPQADEAKRAALLAADHLMTRYHKKAGIIQAWADLSDPEQRGRTIIDSLMNVPLLFWASEQTGNSRYAEAATTHLSKLRDYIIRPDNSTFHAYHFDVETGTALRGTTQQGYSDSSCWARGQAWGILGFAMNYTHTKDPSFIQSSLRCADYYLDHLPKDLIPYWDLVFSDGSEQPRDSSSAAIAACGLLELAKIVPDRAEEFRTLARRMAESLVANYAPGLDESNALILHSVYSFPSGNGIDEGCLWGDYFYLELLHRLDRPDWLPYWNLEESV